MQSIRMLIKINSRKKVSYRQGIMLIKIILEIHVSIICLYVFTHMRSHSFSNVKKNTPHIENNEDY